MNGHMVSNLENFEIKKSNSWQAPNKEGEISIDLYINEDEGYDNLSIFSTNDGYGLPHLYK